MKLRQDSRPDGDAGRRLLTVLFCDLVGSLPLSLRLDPEDLRELVESYQQTCAELVQLHEGHVAQYLGDGVVAYFGYPVAHEDDARRAGRAALAIIEALRALDEKWRREHGVEVHARVGLHTGLMVVGDGGNGRRPDQLAMGEAPSIAARIQAAAEPDTVVMSQATWRLTHDDFEFQDLGSFALKGIQERTPLYRVVAETSAASRLSAKASGLSRFVGRESDLGVLLERWEAARAGRTQVVALRGEAGIGKSRDLLELKERLTGDDPYPLEAQCSPYYRNSAFHPVMELVERQLGFTREMPEAEKLERLAARLRERQVPDYEESLSLMAALHSLPLPPDLPPLRMTPQRQRRRTIETLRAWVTAVARQRPTLFIFEDLHWAEPSTLEFIEELLGVEDAPLLIVLTYRPDFEPPWQASGPGYTVLDLVRLDDDASRAIVAELTGAQHLPDAVVERLLARADGNPLFLEEVTKSVLESGALALVRERLPQGGTVLDGFIPPTVQQSLLARIDRLGSAKGVAQTASAIGREFSYELLRVVARIPEPALCDALSRMVAAELLYRDGEQPETSYRFKHTLIQDAAYQSMLRSRRQEIHAAIGRALREEFAATAEMRPELVAHHLTEAGEGQEALPYWQRAGEEAAQRSANREAVSHLTRALELAGALPPGPERIQRELSLSITLGPILMATKGYAHPDVEATYSRAREICQQIGETPQIVPVLFGLWAFYVVRGDLHTARELAEQILRLAAATADRGILLEGHLILGVTLYFLAELPMARQQLESALAHYQPEHHRGHAQIFGQEPGMASHIYLAKCCWVLGESDAAEAHCREASRIAAETDHPHTLAWCLAYETLCRHLMNDLEGTERLAERAIAVSREHGFPIWMACAEVLKGWALCERGEAEAGIELMREGIARWRSTGTNLYTPYWLGLLGSAESGRGNAEAALRLVRQAVALETRGEERVVLAELHRLHGEILRHTRGADPQAHAEAEDSIVSACAIARRQGASGWERRAALSLAASV